MWRLVFSRYKLKATQRLQLQQLLDNNVYTCGSKLKDLNLSEEFNDVEIKDHCCNDPIEKLHYSANLEPLCIYCGKDEPFTTSDQYPQCESCLDLPNIFLNSCFISVLTLKFCENSLGLPNTSVLYLLTLQHTAILNTIFRKKYIIL